ncbi:MAG: dTMP kinase [Opitutaceae bacterium]|jgi:dTMP kinase|nr:dTMP kinase [Opitutaceae bacterium]
MPLKNKHTDGILISFEGSEGSGKTTQISRLAQRLQKHGLEVVSTREPGGTAIGEQIRTIIVHNSGGDEMCAETELLLFAAARAQLVRETIAPALLRGAVVLCDRYLDSSTVYQGIARNLGKGPVNEINRFAVGNVMPHITVIIDVPTKMSLQRIHQRASDLPDRMERENIDFYEKVRVGYLVLARGMPERFIVVDGTKSKDTIEKQIWAAMEKRLFGNHKKPLLKKKPAPKPAPSKTAPQKPATGKPATPKTVTEKIVAPKAVAEKVVAPKAVAGKVAATKAAASKTTAGKTAPKKKAAKKK